MGRYVVRRLLYMLLVVLVVSVITFLLMHAVPGGPFTREKALPAETLKVLNERYHLDDPIWVQYTSYVSAILIPRFSTKPLGATLQDDYLMKVKIGPVYAGWMNFGPSYKSRSRTVNKILRRKTECFSSSLTSL